jgi:hypothetical protein
MSDSLDPRQRHVDNFELIQTHLDTRQSEIHTAMPGKIVSFDPAKMTARVQLSIQQMQRQQDGSSKAVSLTEIRDVPVAFPGGGGHTLTFPVKAGDDCMVQFCERSIDGWHDQGGDPRPPNDLRMHDVNDAIAHVGLRSQKTLPSGGASATTVQLRSDDGSSYIELDPGMGVHIKTGGKVRIEASRLEVTGEIVAKCDGGSVTLSQHKHTQKTDSHGDTEQPTDAAIPGT